MLRQMREDARDYPATLTLCALWVGVFALMVESQRRTGPPLDVQSLILGLRSGHRFGDLTLNELFSGEVWRVVTATFVHYGLLHIGMNLYALYHLGCLVESWYGSGPLVAIYVLTGGLGNLTSGLVRHGLRYNALLPSGGGSVVVMGLVGLCAVVGWRARTRQGDFLRDQMVWVLGLTAAIGLLLPAFGLPIIDNWGHACGAAVGAVIGLANEPLIQTFGTRVSRAAGACGWLVLAASAAAQVADDRVENRQVARSAVEARTRLLEGERVLNRLVQVRSIYHDLLAPGGTVGWPRVVTRGVTVARVPAPPRAPAPAPSVPTQPGPVAARPKADPGPKNGPGPTVVPIDPDVEFNQVVMIALVRAFDSLRGALDRGPTAADYRRVQLLLLQSLREPPTADELREAVSRLDRLADGVRLERNALIREVSQDLSRR